MEKYIGVRFKENGKVYFFAHDGREHAEGEGVIVETSRGVEYAEVCVPYGETEEESLEAPLKPIIRVATKEDRERVARNAERKPEAERVFEEKTAELKLPMKLVDCEFAFDGGKVTFYFTAENRVDFRELVRALSSVFHMRIELRQIGIKEEIRMLGGMGPCGRECCCAGNLPDVKKVSIKMAKNQGLSLNPGKISGLCGRLMCCLAYENDYYAEACRKVPKVGSEVGTPEGRGMVVNVDMLKMEAKVRIEQKDYFVYRDFGVDELEFRRGGQREKGAAKEDDDADEAGETGGGA